MKKYCLLAIVLLMPVVVAAAKAPDSSPLHLIKAIPLPDVKGRIDHMDFDPTTGRLFVAALGNNSVEVMDVTNGSRIQSIDGLNQPQGVLVLPERKLLLVTNAGDGTVRIYDSRTYAPAGATGFSSDADNVRYDREGKLVYVGYGEGAIGILDAGHLQQIGDIPLAAHPESFQIESAGKRIFVNIPKTRRIAVLDKNSRSVLTEWTAPNGCSNFPMALDEAGGRLFAGCRNPGRMAVYDTGSGKAITEIPVADDADDIWYDAARRRVYISCGAGVVQVFQRKDSDGYTLLASISTARGARTSLFAAGESRLYVAVPSQKNRPARILVFSIP